MAGHCRLYTKRGGTRSSAQLLPNGFHRDDQWWRKKPLAYGQKALRRLRMGFSTSGIGRRIPQFRCWIQAMPTYQYRCQKCGKKFERTETISDHEALKVTCPKCGSKKVSFVPGNVYVMTAKKS
jgi:putative FmdB family regulatory protein